MTYPSREQSVVSHRDERATALSVRSTNSITRRRMRDTWGQDGTYSLARALGWFSIGLGLTQLLMPRKLSRAIGVGDDRSGVLPLLGVCEIAAGLGVLAANNRAAQRTASRPTRLRTQVVLNRPAEQLYATWRNLQSIPTILRHISAVQELGDGRSRWIASGPADLKLEWTAEITHDIPNQRISWRSLPDGEVQTEASVEFKPLPAGRGTVVTLDIGYEPSGASAAVIAKVFGKAIEQQIENDLRRWKQLIETGEVATTEGQPHGKRSAISRHLP